MKTDQELLEEVARRNHKAFESLYEKYNKILFRKCYARVKDVTKAEETMQNLWIDVWEHPERIKYDADGNAGVMLSNYLYFRVLDMHRKESADIIAQINNVPLESIESELSYVHVSEELDIQNLEEVITNILNELPGKKAEIFMMLHRDGYTVKETAKKLNLNERTIRAHSKQSLSILKKEIKKEFSDTKKFKVIRTASSSVVYLIFVAEKLG